MDIASFIGLIGGLGVVMYGAGGNFMMLVDIPSVFITVGGSYLCLYLTFPLSYVLGIFKVMGRCFKTYDFGEKALTQKLVAFSEKARREGILALEEEIQDLDDEFMRNGLRLVVDGTDGEVIRSLMENELNQMEGRHNTWITLINAWATLGPGFGMLGTVIGLIGMLGNLEDKSSLGPNMAVALVTTLYGSLLQNWLFVPMSGKLGYQNAQETKAREMVIEGVLSIQAGDNPRILAQKMLTYLTPKDRKAIEADIMKD
ncbi:MAG TPA: motility protein A [Treponemataceae bacterium]|jgi:chemotaxis protein MotA|nr:motility protein A [Treponemataceae bacterium]HQL33153.1 motility protein A [Treponemataceae bacterium]